MIPGKAFTLEDIPRIVWRRKWWIVSPFVLVAAATFAVSRQLPDRYRSETLILATPQRIPESFVRSTVTAQIGDRLPAITEQILSRTRLERIILDFHLYREERRTDPMEVVVARMRSHIDVKIVKDDSLRLTYEAGDPETAQSVTARLASHFIDENRRDREGLASGTSAFIENQLEDARRRLVAHEKRVEAYRREHAGELPSQTEFNLRAIESTEVQLRGVLDSQSRDRERRHLVDRSIADLTSEDELALIESLSQPQPSRSGEPSGLQEAPPAVQLDNAQRTLKSMEIRLTPDHPDVVRLKRVVQELSRAVAVDAAAAQTDVASAAEGAPASPVTAVGLARRKRLRELRTELESLDRQLANKDREAQRLQQAIEGYQARLRAAPARESDLVALTRDYETLRTIYTGLLTKREDSKIAENMERREGGEQFKIIDPARRPERPFQPNRLLINAGGTLAGLAFGIALAVLLEFFDKSVRSEAEVTSVTGLPVLAMIPVIAASEARPRWALAWLRR